ncbi:STAS domain-containing protein [Hydrogenovibrio kuenenii]|uniref:STAS domain-containing protein n=1 Tax=Hydrogenovibrio kuenenii TaxID=63658 RepID=UPI0004630A19|nr:STAS domain-containing protein [Hydrogenovibrio kuenenii]
MGVKTQVNDGVVNIYIKGNFDISCYDDFNKTLNEHLDSASKFVINLSETTYMDSSALGMLLLLREKTGGNPNKVEFSHVTPEVMNILKVAKFDQLFTIV